MESLFPGIQAVSNLHPLFIHAPLTLLPLSLLLLTLGTMTRREGLFSAGRWTLYLGALSALTALGSGYWAADSLGHDSPGHELVHLHRDYMLYATIGASVVAAFVLLFGSRKNHLLRWLMVAALGITVATTIFGADRGAMLVFGHGVGVSKIDTLAPRSPEHFGEDADDEHQGGEPLPLPEPDPEAPADEHSHPAGHAH